MIWIAIVMLSLLPLYLSSWMVPGWLVGANTVVQTYVVKDLHVGGQIHKTAYLAGIFSGTAALVALRWIFTVLPCTFYTWMCTDCSYLLSLSLPQYHFWSRFRDVNVLFLTSYRLGSRLHSSTGGYIRTEEDRGGISGSW